MCNPVAFAAVSLAMAAGTTAMSIRQQNKIADAEKEAAKNAAIADYNTQELKQQQIAEQANDTKLQRKRQAMRERANLRAATAESGLNGAYDRMAQASILNESLDLDTVNHNYQNNIAQTQLEKGKTFTVAQSRINTANSKKVSTFDAGLRIASSGISSGLSGYSGAKVAGM